MVDFAATAVVFVVSLAVLLYASAVFTSTIERIGLALGVSPFVVGATVVSAGTTLPELASSTFGVLAGESAIVVGNVVGSNVANIFLVLGLAAALGGGITIDRELVRVDLPLLVASAAFVLFTTWDGTFAWYEGALALAGLVVYVTYTLQEPRRLEETVEDVLEGQVGAPVDVDPTADPTEPDSATAVAADVSISARTVLTSVAALALVIASANFLVQAVLDLAASTGVATEVVAITAIAIGTSLPEIAVGAAAVRQDTPGLAVGNVLGANVFNAFWVMGVPSFLGPLSVSTSLRAYALPAMLVATLLYFFITQDRVITRYDGFALLLLYAVFVVNLFSFT
ncbi:calcium/sodium antiporter [Halorubellus litoreus]|uniref:Calcium/sodium antiporter n=1 Tax=Halorubellus litoreus TaxID=755308 RepID=A0ABD5VK86_9EURY